MIGLKVAASSYLDINLNNKGNPAWIENFVLTRDWSTLNGMFWIYKVLGHKRAPSFPKRNMWTASYCIHVTKTDAWTFRLADILISRCLIGEHIYIQAQDIDASMVH